ncbi:MAG TPA: hypothetical protein VKE22_11125 [Haliangiales bacterium]|nr:hypothetical protein [Haliangiales bacterium]
MRAKIMAMLAAGFLAGACGKDEPPPSGVQLIVWVTDMVNRGDDGTPDTVADKIVLDTENPDEFDGFLVE